jgi:xylan 1,4-beta-xylosidase
MGEDAARADWEARIGQRRAGVERVDEAPPAPVGLYAVPGRGQVTLGWSTVDSAVGYQVYRDGEPLDHHGGDVLAVPHPPYADTTGSPGQTHSYAVAALADVGVEGPMSEAVEAASRPAAGGTVADAGVAVVVDAGTVIGDLARPWRPMIGAEHLSHLLSTDTTGGRPIGAELTEALRRARAELGVETVRSHAILCDDVGPYREDGSYDFGRVDAVYDHLLGLGLRPVVELSFMPRALAADPDRTVFAYGAIISPPKDWDRWYDLVRALVAHLVDRYGLDEVRDHWSFEVWNEANLEVFWSGTWEEHLRLYDLAAAAVKSVDPGLRVGGPASAAGGWMGDFLREATGPVDFVSTHTYGSPPLDFRPLCARLGRPDLPIWWTEWGITPTHFNPVCDGVFAAAFLLRGMRSAAGRIPALSYWVVSDHFEELGRPEALLHGGFGLLTVGNLAKPRYWALALAEKLGRDELGVTLRGDGAGSLVEAWAARREDGTVTVLVWNGTLDQSKAGGCAALDRQIDLRVDGIGDGPHFVRHWRVDATHSNVAATWAALRQDDAAWPDDAQWEHLRSRDVVDEYEPGRQLDGDSVELTFPLPMPGISYLEIGPGPG